MRRGPRAWLVRPLLAGLLLRLLALFLLAPHVPLLGDAGGYVSLARSLSRDGSFTDLPGGVRPPLYPLLVSLGLDDDAGDAAAWPGVFLLQIACDLAALAVLATLARRLFGARAGAATAWTHALFPSVLLYSSTMVMAEPLALLCTAIALGELCALDRALGGGPRAWAMPALGLGAALGVGLLAKETGALVAVAALLALVLARPRGRRLAAAGVAVLALLLVTAPWTLRNLQRHGVALPTGSFGHLSVVVDNAPPGESGWLMLQKAPALADKVALSGEILRRQFLEYPGLTARRAADRARMLLGPEVVLPASVAHGCDGYDPDSRSNLLLVRDAWVLPRGVGRDVQLVMGVADAGFFALAAAGLVLAGAGVLRRATVLAAGGLLLSTAIIVAIGRYRLTLAPFALPFAGLALAALSSHAVRAIVDSGVRRTALRAGLVAAAVLVATVLLLPAP